MMDVNFNRGPLQQDTGLLRERWQQSGSGIVNVYGAKTAGTGVLVYTVTAGKTLYITDMVILGNGSVTILDLTNNKMSLNLVSGVDHTYTFKTPLFFTNTVKLTMTNNLSLSLLGWEE